MWDASIYALRSLEVLMTVISCSLHSLLLWRLSCTTIFHPILRLCLFTFEFSSILFSITHSAQAIVTFALGVSERVFPQLSSSLSPLELANVIVYIICAVSTYTMWLSQTCSVLERAVSTRYLSSYQDRFRNAKALALFISIFLFINVLQIALNLVGPYYMIFFMIFYSSINLSVSLFLLRVNKKEDKIERCLSVRYQIRENLKILRVFSLIAAISVIWQLTCTFLIFVAYPIFTSQAAIVAGHAYVISTECYSLTATIFLLSSSVMGSRQLLRTKKKVETTVSDGDLYRRMLQRQWS